MCSSYFAWFGLETHEIVEDNLDISVSSLIFRYLRESQVQIPGELGQPFISRSQESKCPAIYSALWDVTFRAKGQRCTFQETCVPGAMVAS